MWKKELWCLPPSVGQMLWLWKYWSQCTDCLHSKGQEKGGQPSGSSDAPKKKHFYAIHTTHEKEASTNVVTDILRIFVIDVYALLDPGDTLSSVTPLVAKKFHTEPDILCEPFVVNTLVGESIVAKRVDQNCLILLANRFSYVEPVELDMVDFDVLLDMDWFQAIFVSIGCRT